MTATSNEFLNDNVVYVLYAHRLDYEHHFSEVFSSEEKLQSYLENHSEVQKDEVCIFEIDPE